MGELFKNCYECGKTCINGQFSLDGDSPNSDISLPRTLKVKVIANPAYWGFDGGNDNNVLVSGYAYFSNGHYDFFYGYNEEHIGCRVCGRYQDEMCSKNDQRPDVGYRAILSETGTLTNYNYNTNDGVTRGGAEVFLIDRSAIQFSDSPNCESTDPETIFKKNPDNYGFGNKILFKDAIYKNITGGWRLSECSECYSSGGYNLAKNGVCNQGSSSYLEDARQENNGFLSLEDGYDTNNSKQNIRVDENFGKYYDPSKKYCTNHSSLNNCLQDGASPTNYGGQLISLTRDESTNNFIQAKIKYLNDPAYALKNGDYIVFETSEGIYDGGYYIMDAFHDGEYSFVNLLGTYDSENPISYTDVIASSTIITYGFNGGNIIIYGFLNGNVVIGGNWQIYNTIDPNTCCGGAAYGVDNDTKKFASDPPYHVDIKKIFNNSKNELYSNREKFIAGKPRKDYRYISTSGGVPILDSSGNVNYAGEFPYYGPHYEANISDTLLRTSKDQKTTYQNGTCYTKSQELMIFPDSITQSYEYLDCTEGTKHRQNIVPRLTFVYKPCNYNDNCSFNASGQPMTAGASGMPSTLEDLKKGFGGQEIVMHVNLGVAWGNKTRAAEPCGCGEDIPPGEIPFDPEVLVPSPITFQCFPKFDLRPEEYGCLDPMWYNSVRNNLGIPYQGQCEEQFYDACFVKQPYTTYGYIRNLCGAESNSRVDVLKSLANRQPNGGYRDTTPSSGNIVEPMYVNFLRPLDDTGVGFPTGGPDDYIDVLPPSTGIDDEDGDGIPDMSGIRANKPYWGLTDNQGRLSFPYFYTKQSYGAQPFCPPDEPEIYTYINSDLGRTLSEGFPTDEVPFLIEIDHEDYCVGCSTNQIEDKQYYITLESLPAKYIHGTKDVNESNLLENQEDINSHHFYGFKYGFNHCKYPGLYAIPKWDQEDDVWLVPTGGCGTNTYTPSDGNWEPANPYTGETCECLGDGITVPMKKHLLAGTNMPKYYSTDGGTNSYTPFPSGCSLNRITNGEIMKDYLIYFAAFLHCGSLDSVVPSHEEGSSNNRFYGNLSTLYNCGSCSHSYPATDTKPNLSLDFWYVRNLYKSWFEGYTDTDLTNGNIITFLENGGIFGFLGPNSDTYIGPRLASAFSQGSCGAGYKDVMGICAPYDAGVATSCNLGVYPEWEAAASYSTTTGCVGYRDGDRTIKLGTTVPGCDGSVITLWGYSYRANQSHTDNSPDAGFNRGYPNGAGALAGSGCCEEGCYQGRNPRGNPTPAIIPVQGQGLPDFMTSTPAEAALIACATCDGWKDGLGCLGVCDSFAVADGCYGASPGKCCGYADNMWDEDGIPINRPKWPHHCFANGQESADQIGTFYWLPASGACEAGYYGSLNASHAEIFFRTGSLAKGINSSHITAWDGANIPGIGNITKAPVGEPIAVRASQMSNTGKSTCKFDSGPNKSTYVYSEFARVARIKEKFGPDSTYTHMGPVECTKNLNGSVVPSTCVRPIYPNTMSDIAAGGDLTTVEVIKETCHPEIMTVHRVECHGDGYALHVSREYYDHDRQAYATRKYINPGPPPTFHIDKFPIYGKLDGGRTGVFYENPEGGENPDHFFAVCNTSGLDTYPNNTLGIYDYPIIIPMMSRSDFNSPCYGDDVGQSCVTANEPFNKSYCTPYYDPSLYEGGSGTGASGYFISDSGGNLSFVITSSGSDYVYRDEDLNMIPCARAIFDNPCVGLSLLISSGEFSTYAVTGYSIDYTACGGTAWPSPCCDGLHGSEEDDCLEDPNYCANTIFPTGRTWPVTIIGCDSEPSYICDNITIQECSLPDGDPIYPNFYNAGSGTPLWNFYNLTYDLNIPNSYYLSDSALIGAVFYPTPMLGDRAEPFPVNEVSVTDGDIKTGFINGSLLTNQPPLVSSGSLIPNLTCSYSCIREEASGCGGEFFTNKEFLPRRKYAVGTKVTRYGPLSICAQTAEKGWGNWLHGHVDLTSSVIDTKKLGDMNDVRYLNFVDPSRSGAYTTITEPVNLDDNIIYVNEITTLLGAKHPFFKMLEPQSLDNKSCIMPDSGCFHFLPTHNNSTAFGMEQENFFSGEDVYYTNKQIIREAIASGLVGTSGCLLEPFKIMVDVESCSERLGHIGTSDPMNLSWVVPGVRAGICKGWLFSSPGPCPNDSSCDVKMYSLGYESVLGAISPLYRYTCVDNIDDEINSGSCTWESPPDCPLPDPPGSCDVCRSLNVKTYWTFQGKDGETYLLPFSDDEDRVDRNHNSAFGSHTSFECYHAGTDPVSGNHCPTGMWLDPCTVAGNPFCPATSYPYTAKTWFPRNGQDDPLFDGDNTDLSLFCTVMMSARKYSDVVASGGIDGCGPWGAARGYRDIGYYASIPSGYSEFCRISQIINDEYDCKNPDSVQECPYPSVLKVTITE